MCSAPGQNVNEAGGRGGAVAPPDFGPAEEPTVQQAPANTPGAGQAPTVTPVNPQPAAQGPDSDPGTG
jgi:hypothetical protein